MKLTHIALVTITALTLASQVQAAEISVEGVITPPACQAEMTGGGNLVWPAMTHSSLSATAFTMLTPMQTSLKISCDSPTRFAVKFDKSDDSEIPGGIDYNTNPAMTFGIGVDQVTNKKIGNFIIRHKEASYDGHNAKNWGYNTQSHSGDNYYKKDFNTSGVIHTAGSQEYVILEDDKDTAALAKEFIYTFDVVPAINKKAEINSTANVPFAGKAIVTVRYL